MALPAEVNAVPLHQDPHGALRVAGTRVTLDTVVAAYHRGDTPEQMAQDYSVLQAADVYAVIGYYLRHRDEVDAYLSRRRQEARALREEAEKLFPSAGLKERLQSRLR